MATKKKTKEPADEAPKKVGRPPRSESGAAIAVTVKLAPDMVERFRAVAVAHGVSQSYVVEQGVLALEKKRPKA